MSMKPVFSKLLSRPVAWLAVGACLVAGMAPPVLAQGVDFSGKRITVIVPFREGGGTDGYARLLAPFLSRYLPGNPTILVRNIPGAGGVPGANEFQRTAKPDGLMVLCVSSSNITNFALEAKTVRYKLDTYQPILLSPMGTYTYAAPSLGVKGHGDYRNLVGANVVYGGNSPTSLDLRQLFMFDALGMNVKAVWGLNGSKARLAFQRGETNIMHAPANVYMKKVKPLEKKGKAVVLWALGVRDEHGNIGRDPNTPEIPTFLEVHKQVTGKDLSGPAMRAFETMFNFSVPASKALVLPEDTPADIVETFRNAARKMLQDPEFQAKSKKALGIYRQHIGREGKDILEKASTFSPDAKAYINKMLREKFGIER